MDQYIETVAELRKIIQTASQIRVNPPMGGYARNIKVSKASLWKQIKNMDGDVRFEESQPFFDAEENTLYIG